MAATGLTRERWASFTKGQQILMIGSELERIKHRVSINPEEPLENINPCYERIMDLVDLTLEDKKWKLKLKELLRFREVIGELYIQKEKDYNLNSMVYDALVQLNAGSYNAMH
jgi:hypothetical protein